METEVLPLPPKNGKISLRFGEWELRHFQPGKMSDEAHKPTHLQQQ